MMKRYITRTPIAHDGEDVAIGSTLELSDEQAEPLLAVGAVVESELKPPAKAKKD